MKTHIYCLLFPMLVFLAILIFPEHTHSQTDNLIPASTFYGGSSSEFFVTYTDQGDFVLHPNGDIYVVGATESNNVPVTPGCYQATPNGGPSETFIFRMDAGLTTLKAATWLGGSGDDVGSGIAVDPSGNICVTGFTTSPDFPTTQGVYDETFNDTGPGDGDAFVSILTPDLDELVASTFLGGSSSERFHVFRIAVNSYGHKFVTGGTLSYNFPTTPNAFMTSAPSGGNCIFLSKLSNNLSSLMASTFTGGYAWNLVTGLILNDEQQPVICGNTAAVGFPVTTGAYDTTLNGDIDGFVSVFSENLSTLEASTFLGGEGTDEIYAITQSSNGSYYVTGKTNSGGFPVTPGCYNSIFNYGFNDGYISRLNATLTTLEASTYIGGGDWDEGYDVVSDPVSGAVFLTGFTLSTDYPVTPGVFDPTYNGEEDYILSRFDALLTTLQASSYIGGDYVDFAIDLMMVNDSLMVLGNVASSDFPVSPDAWDTTLNGAYDASLLLIDKELTGIITTMDPSQEVPDQVSDHLYPPSPNPFADHTNIRIYLTEYESVTIEILGLTGKLITTIFDGKLPSGMHTISWSVPASLHSRMPAGCYILHLQTDTQSEYLKFIKK
jgi:hypothetical protein